MSRGGTGMRLLCVVALALLLVSPALAWLPISASSSDSDLGVPLYPAAHIAAASTGAMSIQIKNTGTGVLSFSLWRYSGTAWSRVMPFNTGFEEPFEAVADSSMILNAGELFRDDGIISSRSIHLVYINRNPATSYTILYE